MTISIYGILRDWDRTLWILNDNLEFLKREYPNNKDEELILKGRFEQMKLLLDNLIKKYPKEWESVKNNKKRDKLRGYYLNNLS